MKRLAALLVVLAAVAAGALGQSQGLGDAAAKEKARRKATPAGKTYTNEDLAKPSPSPSPGSEDAAAAGSTRGTRRRVRQVTAPSATAAGAAGAPEIPATSAGRSEVPDSESSSPSASDPGAEKQWRSRAETIRSTIRTAQEQIVTLEARISQLRLDREPNPPDQLDPNRLQKRAVDILKATEDIEAAKAAITKAQQDERDLEEEARRKNIPAGWLR